MKQDKKKPEMKPNIKMPKGIVLKYILATYTLFIYKLSICNLNQDINVNKSGDF